MKGNQYKQELARNAVWNAIENYSMVGIQVVCTFVLARYLTPTDFGIVGMLTVFTAIANSLIDSGFSAALIREKNVTAEEYSSVFYVNLVLSLLLYLCFYFSSGWIADFYHQPVLNDICKVTFLVLPLNALCIVQMTRLKRELQFKKICIITLSASIISSIIAISIAYYLQNVWALVIQNIAAYGLRSLILWISSKWLPILSFSWVTVKRYFSFSKNILLSHLIGNIFNNIYSLLIGRFYTPADLGYYSQSSKVCGIASNTSTSVIQNVTYPILSKINNDGANLLVAYKKIISVCLIFVGSVMSLLSGVITDLFEVLMGNPDWRVSGIYFLLMSISGILYPLHAVNQNILMVKGKSRVVLGLEITRRCLLLLILAVTVQFNIYVFVFGGSIYSVVLLFLNLYFCGKPIGYTVWQQLKDTTPILLRLLFVIVFGVLMSFCMQAFNIYLRIVVTMASSALLLFFLFQKNLCFLEVKQMLFSKFNSVLRLIRNP